jgi:hypothetical protein
MKTFTRLLLGALICAGIIVKGSPISMVESSGGTV